MLTANANEVRTRLESWAAPFALPLVREGYRVWLPHSDHFVQGLLDLFQRSRTGGVDDSSPSRTEGEAGSSTLACDAHDFDAAMRLDEGETLHLRLKWGSFYDLWKLPSVGAFTLDLVTGEIDSTSTTDLFAEQLLEGA
ncbi:unnamed protein product [Amoebophrya sp. A25]|nr:unnamed protein product [Amoebophrya sp. A25]|eukprot:GSA25T00021649001.1